MRRGTPITSTLLMATMVLQVSAGQPPALDVTAAAAPAAVHETDHLTVRTSTANRAAAPGTRVALLVEVIPKPKMHVYAPAQQEYIPVSLTLDKSDTFTHGTPVFPPAEKYFFKPLNETQLVYSKPFRIVQDVTLAVTPTFRERARAAKAPLTITGTLRYQACDDAICYLPKNVPVRWTVGLKPQG